MREEIKKIPPLIVRLITGQITDGERRTLQEWAAERKENAEMIKRLSDHKNLAREMRRRRAVSTERQLADMKARIKRMQNRDASEDGQTQDCIEQAHDSIEQAHGNAGQPRGRWRRRAVAIGAAAAVLALLGVAGITFNRGAVPEPAANGTVAEAGTVSHGTTQAMLTIDDGVTIRLGCDSVRNVEALEEAEEEDGGSGHTRIMNLATPRGGEFKITLEDGTEVWLNAQSQLRYPERFDGSERRVQLHGEAYFKVAHDTRKPFVVESGGQQVRVTGTEFNINSYDEDASVYTTLVSGGIALSPSNGNGSELMITPGHQAVFDRTDGHAGVRTVDTGVVTSWRTGSFVFENQTLGQIMVTLSRWYDFDYEFSDPAPKGIVFMGSVPRYGDFAEVLRILEMSGNIKFTLHGKHLSIRSI